MIDSKSADLEKDIDGIENAELLLPFYATGKLSPEEMAEVEAWLAEHPEAQAHLNRVHEEQEWMIADSESLPMPSTNGINKVLERIGESGVYTPRQSFMERVSEFFTPRRSFALASILALAVIGQSAVIGTLLNQDQPGSSQFETASGPQTASYEHTALVVFQPYATLSAITARLNEDGLMIVDGPKPGGAFVIAANGEDGARALDALGKDTTLVAAYFAQ